MSWPSFSGGGKTVTYCFSWFKKPQAVIALFTGFTRQPLSLEHAALVVFRQIHRKRIYYLY